MANITSAQVVLWANTRARTLCDTLRKLDDLVASYKSDYTAQGIAAAITADPAGSTAKIDDGSIAGGSFAGQNAAGDGRASITGTTLANLLACLNQIQTAMDTTNVTGVGSPPMTTINAVQVNGSEK